MRLCDTVTLATRQASSTCSTCGRNSASWRFLGFTPSARSRHERQRHIADGEMRCRGLVARSALLLAAPIDRRCKRSLSPGV